MRKVLPQLKMQEGELVCKDRSGKYRPLFKKQGSLDGACATYSVIMDLLILGTIYEKDTHIQVEHKSANTKKLFKVFCNDYGMYRDGQTFFKINKMLKESFSKIITSVHKMTIAESSINTIVEGIDDNIPVVMSISNAKLNHAMLAIGYEKEGEKITKILCLDPSGDYIHGRRRWNAEITINNNYKGDYCSVIEGKKEVCGVDLEDILIITKN